MPLLITHTCGNCFKTFLIERDISKTVFLIGPEKKWYANDVKYYIMFIMCNGDLFNTGRGINKTLISCFVVTDDVC